jgi:hypothetical protein
MLCVNKKQKRCKEFRWELCVLCHGAQTFCDFSKFRLRNFRIKDIQEKKIKIRLLKSPKFEIAGV